MPFWIISQVQAQCFLQVKLWITINEPWVVSWLGHGRDVLAPDLYDSGVWTYIVSHNLIRSHAAAWHTYDRDFRPTQMGSKSVYFALARQDYAAVCLYQCMSFNPSFSMYLPLSVWFFACCLCVCLRVCVFRSNSMRFCLPPAFKLSIDMFIYLSVCLSVCMQVSSRQLYIYIYI